MKDHLPSALLISYLIRLLVTGASIGDAIVMIALSSLFAGWYWLDSKKQPEPNTEIKNRVIELEEQLKVTKDKINAVTLASTFKR